MKGIFFFFFFFFTDDGGGGGGGGPGSSYSFEIRKNGFLSSSAEGSRPEITRFCVKKVPM